MEEYIHIIDAHSHLWLHQDTVLNGLPIRTMHDGRSLFLGEEVQMLPPFMVDGRNSAEVFLSNMNYARVSAAVVTQELIDGNQNDYLLEVGRQWPDRFFVFGMFDFSVGGDLKSPTHEMRISNPHQQRRDFAQQAEAMMAQGFRGLKIPAARLADVLHLNDPELMAAFRVMEREGCILGIELSDGDRQTGELREVIEECPRLKVVIGHFGMVTRPGWMHQIRLARHENVYIESGGITWLFNDEFWPFPSAVKAIREAADEVGWEKLMWGSDYPRTITAITYRMSFDFVLWSAAMTDGEKRLFLSENARRVFGFGPLVDLPYIKNMSE